MEAVVTLGRDMRMAYQSEASSRLRHFPMGSPTISYGLVLTNEEIRDTIFAGKTISFRDKPARPEWPEGLLVTRDYRPIVDLDGNVMGLLSLGFSRLKNSLDDEIGDLESIVSALECPELPLAGFGGLSPQLCALGELSGSERAALRLRRFLPQPRR